MSGVDVSGREAVGNGFELKRREAVESGGTSGFKKTFVVELGVDEGYVEASAVEEFGYFEHGVHVALSWEWYAHCMWLFANGYGTHFYLDEEEGVLEMCCAVLG